MAYLKNDRVEKKELPHPILFTLILIFISLPALLNAQAYSTNSPSFTNLSESDWEYYKGYQTVKRNINKASSKTITRFLSILGFSENTITALLNWRDVHGGLLSIDELIGAGLTVDDVLLLKQYFTCDGVRKSTEDIIRSLEDTELLENMDYYEDLLLHPLNLAVASAADLTGLPGFNHQKAAALIRYRETTPFKTLLEVTNAGFSVDDLYNLAPFITIKPSADRGLSFKARMAFYKPAPGLSDLLGLKLVLASGPFSAYFGSATVSNFMTFTPWQTVSDSARWYMGWQDGLFKLIAGHYKVLLGQNLLFGPSYSPAATRLDSYPVIRADRGIVGYTGQSADPDGDKTRECLYGAAVCYELKELNAVGLKFGPRIIGFYSSHGPDVSTGLTNQSDYGLDIRLNMPFGLGFAGYTIAHEERADGKYNLNGSSLHYELYPLDWLTLYGESTFTSGGSHVHGALLHVEPIKVLLSGYYMESNFTAPLGQPYLNAKPGSTGCFAGISGDFGVVSPQVSTEWTVPQENSGLPNSRNDVRVSIQVPSFVSWLSSLSLELKSRYSCLSGETNLRSGLSASVGLFRKKVVLHAAWQNLLDFTSATRGNMVVFRAGLQPQKDCKINLAYGSYQADDYNSALFRSEEGSLPGSSGMKAYYGDGVFWSLGVSYRLTDDLSTGLRYRADKKDNAAWLENASGWIEWAY